MSDTVHKVSMTVQFETFGYREQAYETIKKAQRELELRLGRPVKVTRKRVTTQ